MPLCFPPRQIAVPAATRAGTTKLISNSPRTTCSIRRQSKPVCSAAIPVSSSTPDNSTKHPSPRHPPPLQPSPATIPPRNPPPTPAEPGQVLASRHLSRPDSYSTSPRNNGSASPVARSAYHRGGAALLGLCVPFIALNSFLAILILLSPDPMSSNALDVHGLNLDPQTRCLHYHSPLDIIAIKMKCCGHYYACKDCHEALADHPLEPWPHSELQQQAVLCGNCLTQLTINAYLQSNSRCPHLSLIHI